MNLVEGVPSVYVRDSYRIFHVWSLNGMQFSSIQPSTKEKARSMSTVHSLLILHDYEKVYKVVLSLSRHDRPTCF